MKHEPEQRYSRQILLPEVGIEGQKKIMKSKVLVVGAGGLGSPVIEYLVGAGVDTITVVDGDTVDVSNLHRQPTHSVDMIGKMKSFSASMRAECINPFVKSEHKDEWFTTDNAIQLISDHDLILDCVDNFPIKYLINDACVMLQKPYIHAGVVKWSGQVFTYVPGSPCLRCLMPQIPSADVVPSCSRAGILGPSVGIVGCMQALEALKLIIGMENNCLIGKLARIDLKQMTVKTFKFSNNTSCDVCGTDPTIKELRQEEQLKCDISSR